MIANEGLAGATFGTGCLLDDLIMYVYAGEGCRLILMGDTAQLPPVGEEGSPALDVENLRGYGLQVREVLLTEVVRQEQASGILWNATRLREAITQEAFEVLPKFRLSGFTDVKRIPGDELIDALSDCYDRDGMDQTIVICRSNKRANIYNNGIRGLGERRHGHGDEEQLFLDGERTHDGFHRQRRTGQGGACEGRT